MYGRLRVHSIHSSRCKFSFLSVSGLQQWQPRPTEKKCGSIILLFQNSTPTTLLAPMLLNGCQYIFNRAKKKFVYKIDHLEDIIVKTISASICIYIFTYKRVGEGAKRNDTYMCVCECVVYTHFCLYDNFSVMPLTMFGPFITLEWHTIKTLDHIQFSFRFPHSSPHLLLLVFPFQHWDAWTTPSTKHYYCYDYY